MNCPEVIYTVPNTIKAILSATNQVLHFLFRLSCLIFPRLSSLLSPKAQPTPVIFKYTFLLKAFCFDELHGAFCLNTFSLNAQASDIKNSNAWIMKYM